MKFCDHRHWSLGYNFCKKKVFQNFVFLEYEMDII